MRALRLPFLALLVASPAFAQAPVGPEFRVNTNTTGSQLPTAVAADPSGNFVVVWSDSQADGRVSGQMLDALGQPRGSEFRVNAYTTGRVTDGAVATDAAGGIVVAWSASRDSSIVFDVFARRFDAAGTPLTGDLLVNTYTTGSQLHPAIAVDGAGGFVVTWASNGQDGSFSGVYGQRFDPGGARLGAEFRVNSSTTGHQDVNSIAMDGSGNFVVVWDSDQFNGTATVAGQRFTAAGSPLGGEFQVNAGTSGVHRVPAVAAAPGGQFVVAWVAGVSEFHIRARRFSAAGNPLGLEFAVELGPGGVSPAVSMNAAEFAIVWRDWPFSLLDAKGRRFAMNGQPRGPIFRVNTASNGNLVSPRVALDPAGNALAVWTSDPVGPPAENDVFAQRFGLLDARALAVDTAAGAGSNGNGVLEPGEDVDVRPSWQNNTAAAQTLAGALTNLAGPPGATYTLIDGAGSYGTVPAGGQQACVDCYAVGVSSPPVRPTPHWDLSVRETIGADDGHFDWALHVGDSFADVPRSNPFYRFVETMLHRNLTGGCANGNYCPADSTLRFQMTVFVLAAAGVRSAPPACVPPPMFADVPSNHIYCRWIEELARRGVVAGCGGGNFCPDAPVSREQMAVFVLRTLDPTLNPPACTTPLFGDVPASSPFCRWIEELARRGVVTGCGGGNYCPTLPVTREQMSVFLTVTFGLTLYGP
jgi:hypothetical protein